VIAAGLIGDLNMDGVVDSTDYGMLDIDYTYGLLEGDITHQGFVDSSSYAAMDTCYTYQGLYDPTTLKQYSVTSSASASATGASGSPSSVPEPATGSLLITGAIAALNYRRKIKTA